MMNELIETNDNNDKKVFHDEYFSARLTALPLIVARLALLCVMSGVLVSVFCKLYGFAGNIMIPVGIAVGASMLIYMLAMLFPPVFVYGGITVTGLALIWIFRQKLYVGALYFWDYMMLKLDSRLLKTSGMFVHNEYKIRGGAASEVIKMNNSFFWAAVILAILAALVFTAAVRTRYKLMVPVIAIVLVTAPSVAAENAKFIPDFLLYIVCVFGFAAVSSSYDLDNGFIFGKTGTSSRMAAFRAEKHYKRRTMFYALKKRIDSDISQYYRYTPNFVASIVVTAVVFFGISSVIPDGMGISYQKVFDTMASVATDIFDRIGELLNTPLGTADDRNYFSDDEYGGITGNIGIDPPNSSDRTVLEVTLSRNDVPVYLRGDIGVDFVGNSWTSVSSVAEEYDSTVGVGFCPEAEYQVFRRYAKYALGAEPDDILPLQMVKVHYMRNTRVVFQPLAAFDLNYRTSGQYNCYGDFILRTKSGFIGNYEGLALTPNICAEGGWTGTRDEMLLDSVITGNFASENEQSALLGGSITVPDMTNDEYMRQMQLYRGFIERTYKKANYSGIDRFLDTFNKFYITSEGANMVSSLYPSDNVQRYRYSQALCEYFAKNFTYSLEKSDGDQLGEFLYSSHRGHCALFATAMTLTLRELGVPARYVTGYVVYPGSGIEQKDGSFRSTLSERMLHAWVEVYFRGVGWLPFDPTVAVPGYAETVYGQPPESAEHADTAPSMTTTSAPELTETAPSSVTSVDETTLEPDETAITSDEDDPTVPSPDGGGNGSERPDAGKDKLSELMLTLLPFIAGGLVVIALVIVAVMFVKSVGRNERRTLMSFRRLPPTEATALMYRFVLKLLEMKGLVPDNELIADFAERADGSIEMKGSNAFMSDVVVVFEKCEFGSEEVSPVAEEEREAVWHYTAAVYKKVMGDMSAPKRFFTKISLFL